MPTINRTHDDLHLIASGLRQTLLADELLGLLTTQHELDLNITPLSLTLRQALAELAADLEAVAQEHAGDITLNPVLSERIFVLEEVARFARRAGSAGEVGEWCELNARLVRAVEDA